MGSSNQVAYSSLAPPSCTSESDFDSNHDLTIVVLHKEISVRLQVYLSPKKTWECGSDQSLCHGFPDNVSLCYLCHSPRVIHGSRLAGDRELKSFGQSA